MSTDLPIFDQIRTDDDVRAGYEALATRDGVIGAQARVALALADGETPTHDDCEAAGMGALYALATRGNGGDDQ